MNRRFGGFSDFFPGLDFGAEDSSSALGLGDGGWPER